MVRFHGVLRVDEINMGICRSLPTAYGLSTFKGKSGTTTLTVDERTDVPKKPLLSIVIVASPAATPVTLKLARCLPASMVTGDCTESRDWLDDRRFTVICAPGRTVSPFPQTTKPVVV